MTTTTIAMTIRRHHDNKRIGTVRLTASQQRAYRDNEGPSGVIRLREIHEGQYAAPYDLLPDYQDTQPDDFVVLRD